MNPVKQHLGYGGAAMHDKVLAPLLAFDDPLPLLLLESRSCLRSSSCRQCDAESAPEVVRVRAGQACITTGHSSGPGSQQRQGASCQHMAGIHVFGRHLSGDYAI